ncbi:MAG TPA: amidohydrolase family protein [Actinomycetota bacterium]|nr:amidohydrolase family protein [Actinomycetota bacterium]
MTEADLVFRNGAVYTVDAARRWAQAVAVNGGRIVAVGTDADVRELVGPRTETIDLDGRMLLPGFQDSHAHPPPAGLEMLRCNLSDAYAFEDYATIVKTYAHDHADIEWVTGGGWSMDVFPGGAPTRGALDAIVPDHPVFLTSRDGHSAWVNSRALALARVTRDTADPADGRIEREPDGEPAGTLHEGAMDLVDELVPPPTQDDLEEGLRVAQAYLHALGITGWQDAIVGGSYPTLEAYLACAGRGELTARVVGALWWDRHRGEEQIEELIAKRAEGPVGRFSPTSVKIMQDGIVENFTAAVLEPYLDAHGDPTDNRGKSFVEPELLKRVVVRLDAEGFQVHFHALAERAVREALDAIEAARAANGMNDHRHHLAHLQIVHPDDIPRFRRLGAVANAQPLWAMNEGQMVNLTIPFLGPQRSGWQYPFASLVRSGAVLAFGSDWSVSSPNPLFEMHVAVNRRGFPGYAYGDDDRAISEPFLPEQAIDLPTAIAAFTMGSAYVNHLDDVTGSIEVGKLADLVVLDRNVFAQPTDELYQAEVLLTLVEGERVHAAGDLA